jgi:hypothetical protein
MIDMRAHNTQTPAQPGVAAARAAVRVRTAPISAVAAFCNSALTTTAAGSVPTPHRRPPIE